MTPAILPRPAGVLSDLEVFWGLAKRMGKPLMLRRPSFGIPYSQIPKDGLVFGPDSSPSTAEAVRWMVSQGSVTYEELAKSRHGILREKDLPRVEAPLRDDGARLDVCPLDVSQEIAYLLSDRPLPDYRYRLAVRRTLGTMNSAFVNAARTRRGQPVNPAYMNPQDMADEALIDGATIEIRSANGVGRAQVQADVGLRRGVVSVTHGWGRVRLQDDPEGALGIFTGRLAASDQLETINFMPRYTGIPINIQPVETRS
jgi:anaerobic selenocysteine-containing dehydrogenase